MATTNPLTPEQQGAEPGKLEDWQCLHCIAGAHTLCVDDGICRCSCRSVSTPGPVTNLGGTVTHKPTKPQAPIDSEGAGDVEQPEDSLAGFLADLDFNDVITQPTAIAILRRHNEALTRQSAQATDRARREELEAVNKIALGLNFNDASKHKLARYVSDRLKALTNKEEK